MSLYEIHNEGKKPQDTNQHVRAAFNRAILKLCQSLVSMIFIFTVESLFVKLLWNASVSQLITDVSPIRFWQAFCILILARILNNGLIKVGEHKCQKR